MLENEKKMDGLIKEYANFCRDTFQIDPELYSKYEVKRGLRDISGKGVLAGLTDISEIRSYTIVDSEIVPCDGKLFYQGIDIEDIVSGKYTGDVYELKTQPAEAKKYISAETTHNVNPSGDFTGENTLHLTAHITKIEDASATNTGLVDAYDVKQVIDNIFEWVDLSKWATE